MYIPKTFEMNYIDQMIQFIKENSFGVMVSMGKETLHGTHLPFLVEKQAEGNVQLIGHMSKANRQWREIEDEVMIIFSGPHAYVSPSWYEEEGFVPTWDYQAVHVYGRYIPKRSATDLKMIMNKTIKYYNGTQQSPSWDGNVPDDVYNRLINGVEGFFIEVTDIQGQWKLHQDHTEDRRYKVAQALRRTGDQDAIDIAKAIEELDN